MSAREIDVIVRTVEALSGLAKGAIRSRCRSKLYTQTRLVAAAIILDRFPHVTSRELADALGFADHSSAIYYSRKTLAEGVREWPAYRAAKDEADRAIRAAGVAPGEDPPAVLFGLNSEIAELALRLVDALARAADLRNAEHRRDRRRKNKGFGSLSPQPTTFYRASIAPSGE